jgi:hypothetical protein
VNPGYWGASATAWAAWTAVGTLALASATVGAIIVGIRQRRADRLDFADRLLAERRERQDEEARDVTVTLSQPNPALTACRVDVSAPLGYQVKQLTLKLVQPQNGGMFPTGEPDVQEAAEGRMWWRWETRRNSGDELPMISFTDRQGGFYYQYDGHTRRFPPGTSFEQAFPVLRDWLLSGPDGELEPRHGWLYRVTRGKLGK